MKIQNIIYYWVLAAAITVNFTTQAEAQNEAKGSVYFKNLKAKKENRQVSIKMTLCLDSLKLSSNRFLTLTPQITDGTNTLCLRPVVISGRRQHIKYERERRKNPAFAEAEELRFRPGKKQTVDYHTMVPFEKWMHGATLTVDEEWCGCGGFMQENRDNYLTHLNLLPPVYKVKPLLAYVEPKAEAVKERSEKGSAFLDFRVNRTYIDSVYRGNPAELAKIRETIERVKNDRDLTIKQITIHGYASPEGNYALNKRLAAGRTQALKEYVRGLYHFEEKLIAVNSTPEDWEGLQHRVTDSDLENKHELLAIINDSTKAPDRREQLLRNLGDGSTYRFMLREWFPALRHSDYTIHYTIRGFDVEEAKQLIKTRPQKLSLHEMFVVSGEYTPGTDDFNQVFDVAVRMYPEDPIANLNAANIAITDGVYDKAEAYLLKAGDAPEAVHSRGVLALLRGNYELARTLLELAREMGVKEAEHNLEEMQKKIENNKHFSN